MTEHNTQPLDCPECGFDSVWVYNIGCIGKVCICSMCCRRGG